MINLFIIVQNLTFFAPEYNRQIKQDVDNP